MTPVHVQTVSGALVTERPDCLTTEEPLEVRVQSPGRAPETLAVTMRTPGHDFELAVGFCVTERLLAPADVVTVAYCLDAPAEQRFNVVTVRTRRPVAVPDRRFTVSASCGVCGKATLDDALGDLAAVTAGPAVKRSTLVGLPDRLRSEQRVFDATGGLHAAGLFERDGSLVALREDVGRHNALDKLVGRLALTSRLPADTVILTVSGRVSYEIVQKAAVAGIPVVCAVSAPSSLAVDAARRTGQTLVGFLRGDRFNVYAGSERIDLAA